MATILDVGQYIAEKIQSVDKMKLYKLCFFSQAWHLTWAGNPLFQEELQAWKMGPVSPALRTATQPVATGPQGWSIPYVPEGDSTRLTEYERGVIDSIVNFYGHISSTTLSQKTHLSRAWRDARRGLPAWSSCQHPISLTTLRDECTLYMHSGNVTPTPPSGLPSIDLDILLQAADEVEQDWWDTFRILAAR